MFSIYINGNRYQISQSSNVLEACLFHGFDLPYFCWHPVLGSVGSCRQCAVKQYEGVEDNCGRIIMSCMAPVVDGLVISVDDGEVQEFRKNILELLMINHPHDCPICSEGGHCHLQDMTVMTKHYVRSYRFMKHTHINQNLGPFIAHEMNRCINCYRCIRFYKDYADGSDLGVYGVHDNLYFGRFQEGKLESEFSGNLIEICPTGVFTDKTYSQYYARKWDIHFSPSICVHCSVGCNIILGERHGKLCRVENRYHSSINGYFLCDRGRFGYGHINEMDNRFNRPLEKRKNCWKELNSKQAIQKAANVLRKSNVIIGVGSTRSSIESNFALKKLVGADNFYFGVNRVEHRLLLHVLSILQDSGVHVASVNDIENSDAILLLGEDVTQTSPRIALAIRQAVKGNLRDISQEKDIPIWHMNAMMSLGEFKRNPLFITNVDSTKLDDVSFWTYYASLYDQARFGFSVAHAIDNSSPLVESFSSDLADKVNVVVQSLLNARRPLIISGSNVGNESIISSAANIAKALKNRGKDVSISLVVSDVNSMGLAMMGGGNLNDIWDLIEKKVKVDSIIILETDLYRHEFSGYVDNVLGEIGHIIVLDHQKLSFHSKVNLIFPSSAVSESDGTFINQEGRAQRFFRVYDPKYYDPSLVVVESWRWLCELYSVFFSDSRMKDMIFDDLVAEVVTSLPKLSKIRLASPDASFRLSGQKLSRAPHRLSGRTAIHANINVHEPRALQDKDSMFTFSMEGNNTPDPARQHIAFVWAPGWNSSQAWNKFHSEMRRDLCSVDSGVRFFECADKDKKINWFYDIPSEKDILSSNKITHDAINTWYVVPYWHIFGSEEMSQRSLSIQECMLDAYVVLNKVDAMRLNLYDKKILKFQCGVQKISLPLVFSDNLASGCIGLPIGLPGISFAYLGSYICEVEGFL